MDKITVIDIEPMIIERDSVSVKWVHPFITEWAQQDNDGIEIQPGDVDCDNQVYEVVYSNKDQETLRVCFKSRYMDQTVTRYFQEEFETGNRNLFEKPFVDAQAVVENVAKILSNGAWKARNPPHKLAVSNKDLMEWNKTAQIKQFHGTVKGDKIASFFDGGWSCSINIFCYLDTDGKDWWYEIGD